MIATVSPKIGFARLTPCMAIEPKVTEAASLSSKLSGTLTTKLRGTETISAWFAFPAPAQATLSPIFISLMFLPASITTPAQL